MPALQFAQSAYSRPDYGLAEARLVNLYTEATPGGPTRTARLPRPGMVAEYSVGSGPVWGLFQQNGVFGGVGFALSNTTLYKATTPLGTVATSRNPRFAASDSQLVVTSGGLAYCYDGTTFARIADEDLPLVDDVVYLQGRFYFFEQDSDRIYYSAIGDATSIDGLAFLTAESRPDASLGGMVVGDEIWVFGVETVEPLSPTGDANNPLQRSPGRVYQRGCAAQLSLVTLDNTAFWLGDDRIVYRGGQVPLRISNHGVESRIRASGSISDIVAYPIAFDGHSFYVINIPGQTTFAYDLATQTWAEWTTLNMSNFRVRSSTMVGGIPYMGDAITGQIWRLDPTAFTDGTSNIERVASCAALVEAGAKTCASTMLQCVRGVGLSDNTVPLVEMRFSDDAGRTWSDWAQRSLGVQGAYRDKAVWRRLGQMRSPGRSFEFRTTEPVDVVMQGATYNEVLV